MAVSAPTDKRFRRARVTPAAKRRRVRMSRWRVASVAVLGAILLVGAYGVGGLVLATDALTVTRITVSGNTKLSRGEVLSLPHPSPRSTATPSANAPTSKYGEVPIARQRNTSCTMHGRLRS